VNGDSWNSDASDGWIGRISIARGDAKNADEKAEGLLLRSLVF